MPQELKLTLFEKGDYQDPHGNYWCNATFELPDGTIEDHVKWVVKDPMTVKMGESYYGELEAKTSQAGKPYLRFYRKPRPDDNTTPAQLDGPGPAVAKAQWQPRDDSHIRAQWAIGQAVSVAQSNPKEFEFYEKEVEMWAKKFYAMVDRVKGSSESTNPKATGAQVTGKESGQTQTQSTGQTSTVSGYEKAKQVHQTIKAKIQEPSDAELAAAERSLFEQEPVNLADIPF